MSEVETMTLTEFLLARIAEDEAVAQEARQYEYLSAARDASALRWGRDVLGYGTIFVNSGRALAECEAKRRIVLTWEACQDRGTLIEKLILPSVSTALGECLRALALPYADHPHYREEWRA